MGPAQKLTRWYVESECVYLLKIWFIEATNPVDIFYAIYYRCHQRSRRLPATTPDWLLRVTIAFPNATTSVPVNHDWLTGGSFIRWNRLRWSSLYDIFHYSPYQ
jgi:hypothetical protein